MFQGISEGFNRVIAGFTGVPGHFKELQECSRVILGFSEGFRGVLESFKGFKVFQLVLRAFL